MLCLRLFKLPSSELRKQNFDYKITTKKAEANGYIIALGESQVTDWLYQKRGFETSKDLHMKVTELKKNKEYDELNDLLFMKELLQIDYAGRKDLDSIMQRHDGIVKVNGIRYKYLVSKGSSTLTYIKEDLYDYIAMKLDGNRNTQIPLQPAKLSAYKSLAFTNSEQVTAPKNVIVIPDCEVKFEETYLWVGATEDSIEKRTEVVERNICDGCGFISPELAEQWSRDLRKEEKIASAFQVRNLWCKGILCPVDFKKYCIENDTYTIKDVWGHEQNILTADIILTKSMVKVFKGYESMNDWVQASKDLGYVWRVGKVAKSDKWGNSNYQQILPLNLTEDDCREFIKPQIDLMRNVTKENYESTYLFLNGIENTEKSVQRLFNSDDVSYTLANAMMIDKRLAKDKFLVNKVKRNLRGKREEMRVGHCMVESNYQIITCDPIQLLEHMCGVENPKGILKKGEIYSKKHMTQNITECIAFRAPMLIENNVVKVSIAQIDEEYAHYFENLDNVYAVNGNDLMNESLCGFDLDGDTLQLLHNDTIMRAYEKLSEDAHLPVKCAGVDVKPVIVENDDILIQNARIMLGSTVPQIGSVINIFSQLYAVRGQFKQGDKEYKKLTYRLLCGQCISQSTIDAKKSGNYFEIPKHWYKANHIEFLPLEEQEFNARIVADKKPFFFLYNYDKLKEQYSDWHKNVNVRCIAHWDMTIEQLRDMPETSLTEEQQQFLEFVNEQCPVNMYDSSTMKIFTDVVSEELKELTFSTKSTIDCRDLLKFDDVTYDEKLYKKARRLYYNYKKDRLEAVRNARKNKIYSDEEKYILIRDVKDAEKQERDKFQKKIEDLCDNDKKVVVNLLIDMSYNDDTEIPLCWEIYGQEIIENLLEKNDYKVNAVIADENGRIKFKGKKYTSKVIDVREVAVKDVELDEEDLESDMM